MSGFLSERKQVIGLTARPCSCMSTPGMAEKLSTGTLTTELQLEVFGEDLDGHHFIEHTRTLMITRDGATIPMSCKLAPDSEVVIRIPAIKEEALARVVGLIHDATFLQVYGIVFVDSSANPWQVDFPEIKPQKATVMECIRCHKVDGVLLNEIEMAILESTQELNRTCGCDKSSTIWKQTDRRVTDCTAAKRGASNPPRKISSSEEPAARPPQERRRGRRAAMKAAGCIRCREKESFFECEDVSRGGFRFKSREIYPTGMPVEAAVPYAKNSVNIFVSARIAYHQELSGGLHRYGVAYQEHIRQSGPKF